VLVPVESTRPRQELAALLESAFADDTNAWELDGEGTWTRSRPPEGGKPRTHQVRMMRRALQRARRQAEGRGRNR
jgi:polyphosphate kinase